MLIVTTNDVPGYRVVKTLGLARGITVRSRNLISDAIGGLQSMLGGRVGAYVKLAETSRAEALDHLIEQASGMGANAVIAMRYEANEIMEGVTEVLAYGTAELPELQRQSIAYHEARRAAGLASELLPLAGLNHFSIMDELEARDGALARVAAGLAFSSTS